MRWEADSWRRTVIYAVRGAGTGGLAICTAIVLTEMHGHYADLHAQTALRPHIQSAFTKSPVASLLIAVIGNARIFERIYWIDFDATVSDEDLELVRRFDRLEHLGLDSTAITATGLRHLKGMQSLREIYLRNLIDVSDGGQAVRRPREDVFALVAVLQRELPRCRIIYDDSE